MFETMQSSHRLCPEMALVRVLLGPTASDDGAGASFCTESLGVQFAQHSGVQFAQHDRGGFHYRRVVFSSQL